MDARGTGLEAPRDPLPVAPTAGRSRDAAAPTPVGELTIRFAAKPSDFAGWPRSDATGLARCHIFQCADFLEVWLDTIGQARRTRGLFVGVHDAQGAPVLFLPLGIEKRHGVRVLGFLDGTVADYCHPILYPAVRSIDAAAASALWDRIRSKLPAFDVAKLDKMPSALGDLPNPLAHLGTGPMAEAGHVMSLTGSREDLERRLPVSRRHTRYLRQLTREREIVLEVARTPDAAQSFLDTMIRDKNRRFNETRVPGFELPGKLAFFREATRRLPNLAPIHLSAVRAGDTVIASHWGLVFGDRFYFLMTAYADGEWRRFSPGRILNDELIRWCHANGYRWFDFGIGDEAYKFDYCDVTVPLLTATIPVTLRGRIFVRSGAILERLRGLALWRKLRPYKWVMLRAVQGSRPIEASDG